MKLLVPVISAEDVVKCSTLSKNVAYYMGISLAEWNKRFGMHDDLNRISFDCKYEWIRCCEACL